MKHPGHKQYDYQFKYVMVGDSSVGKSSLLIRFADNQFKQQYMTTIGVDFRYRQLAACDKIVKVQIWDTAGQQKFRTIVNTYYKNAQAVYLIFDLGNRDSFASIKNYWINQVQSYTDENTMMILVGNKSDRPKLVTQLEIQNFVEAKKLMYFETSAKNSTNVQQMFVRATELLTQKKIQNKNSVSNGEGFKKLENNFQDSASSTRSKCPC